MSFNFLATILSFGYIGLAAIIFAESGILLGLILPGDSVLFSAGLLASQGTLDIWLLVPLVCAAAILGDSVGYMTGAWAGPALFARNESVFFKKKYLEETHRYFEHYGPPTIVLARFIPGVRTLAPLLAGVGRMRYPLFLRYNVVGGVLWGAGLTLLAYFLGRTFPGIDHYILPIIALIILSSLLPVIYRWWQTR